MNGMDQRVVDLVGQRGNVVAMAEQTFLSLTRVPHRHGDIDIRIAGAVRADHRGHVVGPDGADVQVPPAQAGESVEEIEGLGLDPERALRDAELGLARDGQRLHSLFHDSRSLIVHKSSLS